MTKRCKLTIKTCKRLKEHPKQRDYKRYKTTTKRQKRLQGPQDTTKRLQKDKTNRRCKMNTKTCKTTTKMRKQTTQRYKRTETHIKDPKVPKTPQRDNKNAK